jgi:hypothetical protein
MLVINKCNKMHFYILHIIYLFIYFLIIRTILVYILHIVLVNPLNAELNPICHLLILLGDLTFMVKGIVSISNKMQLYTVYLYLEIYSICFGWYCHPSSGAHTTVSTASGICHTVTVICRHRGRVRTGLSVLWVA